MLPQDERDLLTKSGIDVLQRFVRPSILLRFAETQHSDVLTELINVSLPFNVNKTGTPTCRLLRTIAITYYTYIRIFF